MIQSIRTHLAVTFVSGALLLTSAAVASESTIGQGIIMQRDVKAKTLQIDGRTFKVSSSTIFTDVDGSPLEYENFFIFNVYDGVYRLSDATRAQYQASRPNPKGPWELNSVNLIETIPD
ncbi:MAG: hypothetical protein CBC48_05980 [bacterium TMED88]|nr:hypothetical protein [Deltaproteobacteria bacterium]OUV34419.1 MAG: hypothetical protein CBC48_05980 [bacterium TMED88]